MAALLQATPARAQFLIAGNDEKRTWDENGVVATLPPGKDTVSIIDIRDRAQPRVVANLPLMNSISGPPTNLAVTGNNTLALVANSLDWVNKDGAWQGVPDNKLTVIDIEAATPQVVSTLTVGRQPSGLAINKRGNLAIVTNRADNSLSVLAIHGKDVTTVGTIALAIKNGDPTSVAITPDGRRALVTLTRANKVAVMNISGDSVSDSGYAMTTGLAPYNVQIAFDGKFALVANRGNAVSDGQVDTVSVIDLEENPPRVIDQVAVGDGPRGLAISPAGGFAAALTLNGSVSAKNAFYRHEHAAIVLLRIDGKKVRKVGETDAGAGAQAIAFSPDGRFLYVGNFLAGTIGILRLQGTKLMSVGEIKLPGHPASLRSSVP